MSITDELADLKSSVDRLMKESDENEQIKILQEIGKKLLTEYVIRIGDITVKPLWVEAYYYDGKNKAEEDKNAPEGWKTKFRDPFIHGADAQKGEDHFGKLYFHHKKDDSRSGIDLCLSSGEYYLSFLLKYSLVNDAYTTQSQLSGKIRKQYEALTEEQKSCILRYESRETDKVVFTARVGLKADSEKDSSRKEAKEAYSKFELAAVRDFHIQYPEKVSLPNKENLIKKYLNENDSGIDKAEFCRIHLGYCPKEYK